MKNNNATTFIILAGIIVASVFTVISAVNLMPRSDGSNSYFTKGEKDMEAKIEDYKFEGNKLLITTSGDASSCCIKSTRSTPMTNSMCWKSIADNRAMASVYTYKKYYVWIKDSKGNVSVPTEIFLNK